MLISRSIARLFPTFIRLSIILTLLLGSALIASPAYAAGITVNTTADEYNTGPDCSLREAITAATADAPFGGCAGGSGADVITLPAGTYTLTLTGASEDFDASGDLDIVSGVITINGAGAGSTVIRAGATPGSGIDRVFQVASGSLLSLSGLTVANGKCVSSCSGGGISSSGGLTVTNSTFSGNSADFGGAIFAASTSTLSVTGSTFSGNSVSTFGYGGAVYAEGLDSSLANNVFSSNTGYFGGAIYNYVGSGTMTLSESTFSGNTASYGGAVYNFGDISVAKSTFSGNSATVVGGGLYAAGGTQTVANSTFSANTADYGGGLAAYGAVTVASSTFSGNSAATVNGGGAVYGGPSGGNLSMKNTILANSLSGGDCYNNTGVDTLPVDIDNLIEANGPVGNMCGTPVLTTDPALDPLTNNGGPTQTFAINAASPAYNAGDNASCEPTDQRGVARPQNGTCDIGAFEAPDLTAPAVDTIALSDADPTNHLVVHFGVTFSEAVTGVDPADFSLTPAGVTGASVTGVSGSGAAYTVSVNTGTGSGTIHLELPASASITDLSANPLDGLPYLAGPSYTINKTMTFNSVGARDGWVLESSETSGVGGTLNATAATFNLGDDAANRQYLAILHFDTRGLPDTAVITRATLKLKTQMLVGTNPFGTHGTLRAYIRKPVFGTAALQITDFQAVPASPLAAGFGATPVLNWYSALLNAAGKTGVNRTGTTQFRLRFALDDNNDHGADYIKFSSGNAATAANRPTLIVEYYVP